MNLTFTMGTTTTIIPLSEQRIEVHDFGEHYADDVSHHTHNSINNTTLPLYHPTSTSPISLKSHQIHHH
jgi:hypothetical protein